MKGKYYFSIHTEDYDGAIEKAKEERDVIISELIKRSQTDFILELTVPVKYHERIDEYEEITVAEYEVEVTELFDDCNDMYEYFSAWVRELQEEIKTIKEVKNEV